MKKQPVNAEYDLRLLELRRELRDTAREPACRRERR